MFADLTQHGGAVRPAAPLPAPPTPLVQRDNRPMVVPVFFHEIRAPSGAHGMRELRFQISEGFTKADSWFKGVEFLGSQKFQSQWYS